MLDRNLPPGWPLMLALWLVCLPARAQEEGALPEGPGGPLVQPLPEEPEETAPASPRSSRITPNYVVWRIKPGTGAGALAPRVERKLRKEMEASLGGMMLSKAAQTGIILIRPELADCDANLPCALDVAEALSIRFVVGGEAESTAGTSITGWIVDRERGAEVRRVTIPVQGSGEEAENTAVVALRDALLTPPRMPQVAVAHHEGVAATSGEGQPGGAPRWLGALGLAGGGGLGVLGVVAWLGALLGGGLAGGLLVVRSAYHTRASFNGLVGSAATSGGLALVGALFFLVGLPLAALGAWALLGMGAP